MRFLHLGLRTNLVDLETSRTHEEFMRVTLGIKGEDTSENVGAVFPLVVTEAYRGCHGEPPFCSFYYTMTIR